MTSTTYQHSDTDLPATFAAISRRAFDGHVSVLPNAAVMSEVRRRTGRGQSCPVAVEHDEEALYTVYRIGAERQRATFLLVDAGDNNTTDLGEVADEDDVAELVEAYPSIAELIYEASGLGD